MKILAIRIKNLASLDGVTEIDFTGEPLCSAGIFAITGPTGAGKSTILDALCLALYCKTPRYIQAKETGIEIKDVQGSAISQGDVRGILRDGTGEGFAEVDFAGVDGQRYRATWRVRRARDKAEGSLQQYSITLKNIDTNTDIPGRKNEVLEAIEQRVGLNFEQFTRSVLLAQGDFTAFLKAGKDEKSSLLEKLTGTQIYSEISVRVFENHNEQKQKLKELNLQREGIPTKTSEELAALQEEKLSLEAGIKTQEGLLSGIAKEIHWHEQLELLQVNTNAAQLEYNDAVTDKLNAQPREQALQQIIKVQAIRSTVDELQAKKEQAEDKLEQSAQLKENLKSLHEQNEALNKTVNEAEQELNKSIAEQELVQPLLDSAKKLDVQLAEKKNQIENANRELATSIDKQRQHASLVEKTQQEATQLNETVLQLSQWKTKNEIQRPLAEQADLVLSKLADAKTTLETIEHHTSVIDDAENNLEINQKEKERLQKTQTSIQSSLEKEQQYYKTFQESVDVIPIETIEDEKTAIDISVEDIIHAEAHWKLLYGALDERDNLNQALEQNANNLSVNTEQLSSVSKEAEKAGIEKDLASKMLEKARLTASENIEALRTQLEPGKECPVCGSTEHPFAEHNHQLHNVLTEIEREYQQIENSYTEYLGEQVRLNHLCSHLNKTISEQKQSLTAKEELIKQSEQTWSGFDIYTSCMQQPITERTKWLQEELQVKKSRQRQLDEQIKSYGKQKQQMDDCKNRLLAWEKKSGEAINSIKDIERQLKSLQEKQDNSSREKLKASNNLEKIRQELSPYFSNDQWFENWQKDAEAFVNRINRFARQWKNNIKQLEEGINQQGVLTATIKGLEEQSKNHSDAVQQQEQDLIQLKVQWQDFFNERNAIYNGEAALTVEARVKEAVNQSRKIFEQRKNERDALQARITRETALDEQLEKETGQLSNQVMILENKIRDWLDNHNQAYNVSLTKEELINLLNFTQEWIEAERTALYTIDNAITKTKSVLDERATALNNHTGQRISERAYEELVVLQTEAKTLLQEKQRAANEIAFQLKQDETNKQRIGSLLQSIEKQAAITDDWAKLNDIIGSADGKKFRQMAQEYTLDVLLMYANVHLQVLSKRYVLQRIPGSLGLQVVDQDMGDEVRTVFSLSGGESFLVSLALALGLASLSSSRMKVESLFIDEGFGALDPATLNIAMDALERLHNQGRKVGVISHVQEMTERIPVQIKVSKQQSGKSKVEVVGV